MTLSDLQNALHPRFRVSRQTDNEQRVIACYDQQTGQLVDWQIGESEADTVQACWEWCEQQLKKIQCHQISAPCFVKPRDCPGRWLLASVVSIKPLLAEVVEADPVWRGAVVSQGQAKILVDSRFWPKERRIA